MSAAEERRMRLYAAVWRWHFYAGLSVAPFFLIAALTGAVMALNGPIERTLYADRLFVSPAGAAATAGEMLELVSARFAHSSVVAYAPPAAPDRSAQFFLREGHGGDHGAGHGDAGSTVVYVDPYSRQLLAQADPEKTVYAVVKKFHGTLFLGAVGDYLIEVVAGFGVLLVMTGLYLWLPRNGASLAAAATPPVRLKDRRDWRRLHSAIGLWAAPVLLFFLVSGLAWTPVWGGKFTQAWSAFPATRFAAPPRAQTHADLETGDHRQTPWALQKTPLPKSSGAGAIGLDDVIAVAEARGFGRFRVNIPQTPDAAWTVSAATISGDITDPRLDRTLHLDAATGEALADIGFADYSLGGKLMAAGVPLHQAGLGAFNAAFNVGFCLAIITMIFAAVRMWLLRRPHAGLRLAPPPLPLPQGAPQWRRACALMLGASLLFPLTALALCTAVASEYLLFNRKAREDQPNAP